MIRALATGGLGVAIWLGAPGARAQPPDGSAAGEGDTAPAESQPPQATMPTPSTPAPDVVLLSDGGMVRGTIAEIVPESHVVIVTLTSEMRRYEWSDVDWAGPAAQMPARRNEGDEGGENDEGDVPRTEDEVLVQLQMLGVEDDPYTFFVEGRVANRWRELCVAPCEEAVTPGANRFAIQRRGGARIPAENDVTIDGPAIVTGRYVDNSGARVGGGVLTAGSLLAGISLIVVGTAVQSDKGEPTNWTLVGVGSGIIAAGLTLGIVITTRRDRAVVNVRPL